jgi:hypothetical protein
MKKIIRKIALPVLLMRSTLAGNAQTSWYFGNYAS